MSEKKEYTISFSYDIRGTAYYYTQASSDQEAFDNFVAEQVHDPTFTLEEMEEGEVIDFWPEGVDTAEALNNHHGVDLELDYVREND